MNVWIAPVAGLCLLLSVFLCSCGRRRQPDVKGDGEGSATGPDTVEPTVKEGKNVFPFRSRTEISAALKSLARSSEPSSLSRGAMCYKAAMIQGTVDVTCSACGKKTIHPKTKAKDVDDCLRIVQSIREAQKPKSWFTPGAGGLDAHLDTTGFCAHCSKAEVTRRLHLVIRFRGEKSDHRKPVTKVTLNALLALLKGEDRIRTSTDRELPLKNYLPLLQALMGPKPTR